MEYMYINVPTVIYKKGMFDDFGYCLKYKSKKGWITTLIQEDIVDSSEIIEDLSKQNIPFFGCRGKTEEYEPSCFASLNKKLVTLNCEDGSVSLVHDVTDIEPVPIVHVWQEGPHNKEMSLVEKYWDMYTELRDMYDNKEHTNV